jgi:hypothetical protein
MMLFHWSLGAAGFGFFEESHFEFYAEDSGDGFVDDVDVEGFVVDEGGDGAEVERATSHLSDSLVEACQ